jgi:hypothetical protein
MPTIAPRYGLCETVDMANRKKRIPKLDDRVAVLGHNGAFVIWGVDGDLRTVELKPIGSHFALSAIPWRALTFLDQEDKYRS